MCVYSVALGQNCFDLCDNRVYKRLSSILLAFFSHSKSNFSPFFLSFYLQLIKMRGLSIACLFLVIIHSTHAQCPWQKDVPDLQTACLCAYNLGHELSVQCDQVSKRLSFALFNSLSCCFLFFAFHLQSHQL